MHSSLMDSGGGDEGGGGARDVFVDLGVLIVEGRVPGGPHALARGYGEGPHCVRTRPSRCHTCDGSIACLRAAQLRSHVQLLCENRVPMCVEVLLCADCACGAARAQSPEVAHLPCAADMLLEQWTVSVVHNKSVVAAAMSARGLLQAVRSQLHFSQLSAWWSSSRGCTPAHVSYRVTVPGEAFASHFRSPPHTHVFPVAALAANTAIKVSVKTAPRMEAVPRVLCSLHHSAELRAADDHGPPALATTLPLLDDRMQQSCNRSGKHHCRCDEDELAPRTESTTREPAWRDSTTREPAARRDSTAREPPWRDSMARDPAWRVLPEPASRRESTTREPAWKVQPEPASRRESTGGSKDTLCNDSAVKEACGTSKRVKKEGGRGLHLELSAREFQEVLSVLRERHPHGTRPVAHDKAELDKSDLLMSAILRAQDTSTASDDDLTAALSSKIAKISLDSLTMGSGTKRKRTETTQACERATNIDERTLSCAPRKMNKPRSKVPNNSESVMSGRESPDRPVPSARDKEKFRRNLDFAASMVFHSRTGLPLTSSPAPLRRNATCFAYDSSITSVSAIRSALFDTEVSTGEEVTSSDDAESSPRLPSPTIQTLWSRYTHLASSLLGTFEESALNGRLEPVSTVQGFTASLGASGSFCPRHVMLPVTVFFYTLGDNDKVSTPYLAHINLGKKGYNVPRCGTIQVTLFNPLGTVVKMFVVMYDLSDMPANSQTFLRQRTLYMPANTSATAQPDNFQKWLRYLVHLRFSSSKSGRVYLHSDIRMIIFRKSDLDTATAHGVDMSYELRSFTQGPTNPKFSTRK